MAQKKTILVADDDPDVLFMLGHYLEKWGYEAVTVDSRREAEKFLEVASPDLAIIDLMMEEEDSGFILSYRIKKKDPGIPVIISTAVYREKGIRFDLQHQTDSKWIRADHYLDKGYRMEELRKVIEKLLG
ncbi:MAG TPA: response regulator [Bacteroides sp.]|nr:response regulator [Bacteroides sp.]